MLYLNEAVFTEDMPARAKQLFVKTFKKYHKLDGGDEDIALHMARQAVERDYVRLNDRWIPKTAAEEIVRHDMVESDDEDDNDRTVAAERFSSSPMATPPKHNLFFYNKNMQDDRVPLTQTQDSDYSDIEDDTEDNTDYDTEDDRNDDDYYHEDEGDDKAKIMFRNGQR
ncbi:orf46 [Trichoplusia ni single nucleopolyhedrovirus]|uniref:ChaB n=1 Tax=Trichoplusia ni single nucleopolyhedrovirus TaxID=332054 RepID=Q462B9_9ABAC|nr:orf46 [Trichoplusia ni single nucleopolyhedrovirus]AAZ67417.1 orf46 [Trichoplusia ni single nucleopolyhedrovirus]QBI90270.1 chaB [Trichoplusia ni single nucleopolyhedrovirus]